MKLSLPFLAMFLIFTGGPAQAYEEIQVFNGGTISGKVTIH